MQIYVATPVNGRAGKDISEKRIAAKRRIDEMIRRMQEVHPDDTRYVSSFDVCPLGSPLKSEAEIMGGCVTLVMQSDMVVYDGGWSQSKGCKVEMHVAETYGIRCHGFLEPSVYESE